MRQIVVNFLGGQIVVIENETFCENYTSHKKRG